MYKSEIEIQQASRWVGETLAIRHTPTSKVSDRQIFLERGYPLSSVWEITLQIGFCLQHEGVH